MANRSMVLYRKFERLNEVASPEELQDNELQEAENVIYDEAGGISKRKGIKKVNETAYDTNPINRLIDYSKKEQLLVASGTTLREIDGTVITDGTDPVVFKNTNFGWEVFSDGKLYLVNGDNYYVYDGEKCTEVTPHDSTSLDHIKRCKYLVQRGQRLFAAGDPQNPNTIYFSEIGAANHFPDLNTIDAISDDNDVIMGLTEFHQAMVAFKKHHIYSWFGWNPEEDVRFDKINVHTGAVSFLTIKRVYNFLFYMGEDGVYALHGLEPDYISSNNLTDEVLKRRFSGLIDTDKACAAFYDGKYFLSVKTEGTSNDLVLVYDFVRKAWSPWTGWKASSFAVYENQLYIGSSETGQVYEQHDKYNDDGKAIHYKLKTKPFPCNYPLQYKKFNYFNLFVGEDAENNEIVVTLLCDNKYIQLMNNVQLNTVRVPGANMFDEEVPEGRTRLYYKKARILAKSLRVQVLIENNEVNEPVTIYGIGFQFWPVRV